CAWRGRQRPSSRVPSVRSLLEAVRQELLDDGRVRRAHHLGPAVLTDVLGVVADQAVPLAGDAGLDLSSRSQFEALLGARLRLQFRHFTTRLRAPSFSVLFRNRHGMPFGQAARRAGLIDERPCKSKPQARPCGAPTCFIGWARSKASIAAQAATIRPTAG